LHWRWRFLAAVDVGWEKATSAKVRDFVLWIGGRDSADHAGQPRVPAPRGDFSRVDTSPRCLAQLPPRRRQVVRQHLAGAGITWRASVFGAAAGTVAFLLFVAAQRATDPDVLTGESAKRFIYFVLTIGFTAGIGFASVYAKLRKTDVTDNSGIQAP
jgi:hypothetical protein